MLSLPHTNGMLLNLSNVILAQSRLELDVSVDGGQLEEFISGALKMQDWN